MAPIIAIEIMQATNMKNNSRFFLLISAFSNDQIQNLIVDPPLLNSLLNVEHVYYVNQMTIMH